MYVYFLSVDTELALMSLYAKELRFLKYSDDMALMDIYQKGYDIVLL